MSSICPKFCCTVLDFYQFTVYSWGEEGRAGRKTEELPLAFKVCKEQEQFSILRDGFDVSFHSLLG